MEEGECPRLSAPTHTHVHTHTRTHTESIAIMIISCAIINMESKWNYFK